MVYKKNVILIALLLLLISLISSMSVESQSSQHKKELGELLIEAIHKNNNDIAISLIEAGAELNPRASHWSPLKIALTKKNFSLAKILLNAGADINIKDPFGQTLLYHFVDWNKFEPVKFLIKNGANLDLSYSNRTPLIRAIKNGNVEIVKLLIDEGANVEKKGNGGMTALMHCGIFWPYIDRHRGIYLTGVQAEKMAKLLVQGGADVNAKDNNGKPLLCYFIFESTPRIPGNYSSTINLLKLLLNNGLKVKSDCGGLLLEVIIKMGYEIKISIKEKRRYEIIRGNQRQIRIGLGVSLEEITEVIQSLIKRGANVNSENQYGKTPLMIASKFGIINIVKILIDKGANVNAVDKGGNTALKYAISNNHTEIVKILLKKGAKH